MLTQSRAWLFPSVALDVSKRATTTSFCHLLASHAVASFRGFGFGSHNFADLKFLTIQKFVGFCFCFLSLCTLFFSPGFGVQCPRQEASESSELKLLSMAAPWLAQKIAIAK